MLANARYDDSRSCRRENDIIRALPIRGYSVEKHAWLRVTRRLCPRNQCKMRVNSGRILLSQARLSARIKPLNAAFITLNFSKVGPNTHGTSNVICRVNAFCLRRIHKEWKSWSRRHVALFFSIVSIVCDHVCVCLWKHSAHTPRNSGIFARANKRIFLALSQRQGTPALRHLALRIRFANSGADCFVCRDSWRDLRRLFKEHKVGHCL